MIHTEILPILGVCGFSGSGKTTLIVEILSRLEKRGLKIAVVKHSSSSLQLDKPSKDSDRFFQAGAHVYLSNDRQSFVRYKSANSPSFNYQLLELARLYDLVLVEGYKHTPISKIWLLGDGEEIRPDDCHSVLGVLPRGDQRADLFMTFFEGWLAKRWLAPPVYGCLLIGGNSSRMGRPKHLICQDGKSWLSEAIEKLNAVCERVVVAGVGDIPKKCDILQLADPPGINGPMAGMISALRWHPWAVWLMVACDMPDLSVASLTWLLEQRQPGRWAILPTVKKSKPEPLLACYDFRIQRCMEEMLIGGNCRPSNLSGQEKVATLAPPASLAGSWRNVNYSSEIG